MEMLIWIWKKIYIKVVQVFWQNDTRPVPCQQVRAEPAQTPPQMLIVLLLRGAYPRLIFALTAIFKANERAIEHILRTMDRQAQLDKIDLRDGGVQHKEVN